MRCSRLTSVHRWAPLLLCGLVGCAEEEPLLAGQSQQGEETDEEDDSTPCEIAGTDCSGFGGERPDRLSEHSAAYDPTLGEMIVFGGTPDIPEGCMLRGTKAFSAATWIYSEGCDQWMKAPDGPEPLARHASVWADGDVWVYGGRWRAVGSTGAYTVSASMHRFNVANRSWSTVSLGEQNGGTPGARHSTSLAWDPTRSKLWLFGGNSSGDGQVYSPEQDLWAFDLGSNSWEQVEVSGGPSPRLFHSLAYDEKRDRLVLFGGADETAFLDTARYFSDLWAYELKSGQWVQLAEEAAGPVGRFWGSLFYDPEADEYVAFGGHDAGNLGNRNDSWRFVPETGEWTQLERGDTFNQPARAFCDFPPDFAIIDEAVPERRNGHSLAYSPACGHALVFGGKTDCGSIDDLWSLDAGRWTQLTAAREGEACLRWRGDESDVCSDMCF